MLNVLNNLQGPILSSSVPGEGATSINAGEQVTLALGNIFEFFFK